ncbi:hypothetical protein [Nocardioides sp. GY 10127]|uniref:hypothetical protein n=1 Tax=Nocardioides sp. GY 10127 TaxID=2569762 RepID=UPI0010A8FB20|nr:hypothetical protein [Nocardioides sp. GY 10127]TIC84447.1 hypothetical protein E8D37_06705 [Nocardioides sp. GY 10127]
MDDDIIELAADLTTYEISMTTRTLVTGLVMARSEQEALEEFRRSWWQTTTTDTVTQVLAASEPDLGDAVVVREVVNDLGVGLEPAGPDVRSHDMSNVWRVVANDADLEPFFLIEKR